ncbi:GH3 auxin-responsive promoter family protein [Roseivirga sp. E12]|uniref:GH3 auxin-responsive promoter family protein n=1 Tax=Roseivirga sp. E12 TaxID=2819237 RepID=UPI001ABC54A1|nr:GH3 auxin-responsive promoter family protein [Roseivirga sp. E12]MBO3698843.1 GH3 auxin-responsive promoter family protein [Roseivirga sp. E12]
MKKRMHQIDLFMKYPHEVQEELFKRLITTGRNTEFGRTHGFADVHTEEQFRRLIPVSSYEDICPYIERNMAGEQNLLWPSDVKWFAKSSGTTNARSKFIPVSYEALEECHFKGGKDMLSIYCNNFPETKMFDGKGLTIGGSQQINQFDSNSESFYGDVSAVIMSNLPYWTKFVRTPTLDIALMEEWESKIDKMAEYTMQENVTSISGVPTWTIILLQKVLELKGASHIHEVWPNLEVFFHGAVAFGPYKSLFKSLIPSDQMRYMETYNASEGFFGIQYDPSADDMLLMLDYGIYYEFIPFAEIHNESPKVIGLNEVVIGEQYALLITTNAGLWRYKIGDTVQFTSIDPFRIKISGRTKHFINAFGEEVVVENAERAIAEACEKTGAQINNFTAAPKYFDKEENAAHEWIVEFERDPDDLARFAMALDETLRSINSDYDAKRYKDMALSPPIVHKAAPGTFYQWMRKRGKLGGQHKVPRLSNTREYLDEILSLLQVKS